MAVPGRNGILPADRAGAPLSREENGAGAKTALRLDPRLVRVAAMVRPGGRLADVGTDHGYLICRLAADGVITGGLALDVNEKPLARAAKTIAAALIRIVGLRLTKHLHRNTFFRLNGR